MYELPKISTSNLNTTHIQKRKKSVTFTHTVPQHSKQKFVLNPTWNSRFPQMCTDAIFL